MTPQEAIDTIKIAIAEVEWDYPMDYAVAFEEAIKALEKQIWIRTEDEMPREMEIVNITWVNRNPPPYYAEMKNVPQVATGLMMNGKWYWFSCYSENISEHKYLADADRMDKDTEVIAWLPLPSPYKESDDNEM